MRTLAFQLPEELFQKIKDYLQRNNMTQKEFVIGLIEVEIDRNLTQRASAGEGQIESGAVSDCESVSKEVGKQPEKRECADFSEGFDDENQKIEILDEDKDQDKSEDMGMSMSM